MGKKIPARARSREMPTQSLNYSYKHFSLVFPVFLIHICVLGSSGPLGTPPSLSMGLIRHRFVWKWSHRRGKPRVSFYMTLIALPVKTSRFTFKWSHRWKKAPCLQMFNFLIRSANAGPIHGANSKFPCYSSSRWCGHRGFFRRCDWRYTRWFLPLVRPTTKVSSGTVVRLLLHPEVSSAGATTEVSSAGRLVPIKTGGFLHRAITSRFLLDTPHAFANGFNSSLPYSKMQQHQRNVIPPHKKVTFWIRP